MELYPRKNRKAACATRTRRRHAERHTPAHQSLVAIGALGEGRSRKVSRRREMLLQTCRSCSRLWPRARLNRKLRVNLLSPNFTRFRQIRVAQQTLTGRLQTDPTSGESRNRVCGLLPCCSPGPRVVTRTCNGAVREARYPQRCQGGRP